MALDGGGGGGGPVGQSNSFVGPQQALEVIGNHAYLITGDIPATNALSTRAEFTTGNYYTVGTVQFNGYVDDGNITTGQVGVLTVAFNESIIATLKTDSINEDQPSSVSMPLLIPHYTEVKMQCIASDNEANMQASIVFVGERFR